MATHRLKPLEVTAWQFVDPDANAPEFISRAMCQSYIWYQGGDDPYFTVLTDTGPVFASLGKWIVKLPNGQFFVAGDEYFQHFYEVL